MPGTGVLAILAGPIFGPYKGFLIVHTCSITGACICYMISMKLGSDAIQNRFPEKYAMFKQKIEENRQNLFWYYLFLRLTLIFPNLLINTVSGLVGVPLAIFASASVLGQLPFTFMYIKTGMMLD